MDPSPHHNQIDNGRNDQSLPPVDMSSEARTLLEALQNLLTPIAHAVKGGDPGSPILSSDAERHFLAALQGLISSMISASKQGSQDTCEEVSLQGSENMDVEAVALSTTQDNQFSSSVASELESMTPERPLEEDKYHGFMQKLQARIRERVFSAMPIRVLHFAPNEQVSTLRITLLDRNGICSKIMDLIATAVPTERIFEKELAAYYRTNRGGRDPEDRLAAENDLVLKWVADYTRYTILSHTWLRGADGEVTYGAWYTKQFDTQKDGFQKLARFCEISWKTYGIPFGWMDTVCINKESSAELDESIRSMYKWYRSASVCITFLADTSALPDMHKDPWFSRGWTFQELLAPADIVFYNKDWIRLIANEYFSGVDKLSSNILEQIEKATTITESELRSPQHMPVSRKMQLAARRQVTREEDTAYSLMGICGVSISIAYGEGARRAFFRLMTEILNTSAKGTFDIFNCAHNIDASLGSAIIPSSPVAYTKRSTRINAEGPDQPKPIEPLALTHLGLRISVLLLPGIPEESPAFRDEPIGDYYARVELPKNQPYDYDLFFRLLDKGLVVSPPPIASPTSKGRPGWGYRSNMSFGVLNFGGNDLNIQVPNVCLAVGFRGDSSARWESPSGMATQQPTKEPITFSLLSRSDPDKNKALYYMHYWIPKADLAKHGMKLMTMYL